MAGTSEDVCNPPSEEDLLSSQNTLSTQTSESETITMVDVLKEEQDLDDRTKALLGASDDKNCTYSQGYVKRQALYSCITCSPPWSENIQPGGLCLACSYHCHEGHELVELYTKRNFRCDCGNSKYLNHPCNLEPNKSSINNQNSYNQNFYGLYCVCKRPYPDPDDDSGDIMIQCIICEDWYHERHLGRATSEKLDDGELICGECMKKNEFLACYASSNVNMSDGVCTLLDLKCMESGESVQATVFPEGWRSNLCKCERCLTMYENKELKYLLDEQDTVEAYEELGKACGETQYESGMRALSSMDRVQTVEAIQGYNEMKNELMEYLQKFAESKKVVREEDIREFFSGMEARKKQRINVNIPNFCR